MAKETFVTRVKKRDSHGGYSVDTELGPFDTVQSAVHAGDKACKAGRYVEVKSDRTGDGTRWSGHRGRAVATCERKQWLVETYRALSGAKRRKRRGKFCSANVGRTKAPKTLRKRRSR